jgi:hypothetical protein
VGGGEDAWRFFELWERLESYREGRENKLSGRRGSFLCGGLEAEEADLVSGRLGAIFGKG